MPKVIYKGNGNTGGSVPVDNTNYAANGSFTVAGPGSLVLEAAFSFTGTPNPTVRGMCSARAPARSRTSPPI